MNGVLANVSNVLFFACVPALLVVRFVWPRRMPWWLLVLLAGNLSWIFTFLTAYFADAHNAGLIEQAGGEHAPWDLIAQQGNDRREQHFAFLVGWRFGLTHLMFGLVLYGVAHLLRKASRF